MAKTSHRINISAPKSRVFNALTTKNGLRGWYTPNIEGDVAQGETVVFKFSDEDPFHWHFVELESPTHVRWRCIQGPGNASGTEVIFRLSDHKDGRTTVECDHDGFEESDKALRACNTLWGILMDRLRKFSETDRPQPAHN
jgi:uncharacterized protein YndB with AHSA1/START domain